MGIFQRTFEHLARAAAAAAAVLGAAGAAPAGDNVLGYEAGEPALAEATRLAHARLPRFFELAKSRVEASYLVKIALTSANGHEHVWAQVDGFRDGVFQARLANEPMTQGYALGDPVEVRFGEISDWMVNTGTVRYGGYTIRAMLGDMPARKARELRRQFRD